MTRRMIVSGALFLGIFLLLAAAAHAATASCKADKPNSLIAGIASPPVAQPYPLTQFMPAGIAGQVQMSLPDSIKDGGWLVVGQFTETRPTYAVQSRSTSVTARALTDQDPLVKQRYVPAGATVLTFEVPEELGSAWRDTDFYIFHCATPDTPPVFVGTFTAPTSRRSCSVWASAIPVILLYILCAWIAYQLHARQASKGGKFGRMHRQYWRYADPMVITAGSNGKASASKLQILFFSLIIAGLLFYIEARQGRLSDMSESVAILLGLSGAGAGGAKLTMVSKNRLDYDVYAYFIEKGWLKRGGPAATNMPEWRQILGADGELDVYHVQMLFVSAAIGAALLISGFDQLASFEVPGSLLSILGLSQAIYVGGMIVNPGSFGDLNKAAKELKEKEDAFTDKAVKANASNPAAAIAAAQDEYNKYMSQVCEVKQMFEELLDPCPKVAAADIPPRFQYGCSPPPPP